VTETDAGIPSKIPTKAGPWDSPAVNHLIAQLSQINPQICALFFMRAQRVIT
jgi:hypothetical protein